MRAFSPAKQGQKGGDLEKGRGKEKGRKPVSLPLEKEGKREGKKNYITPTNRKKKGPSGGEIRGKKRRNKRMNRSTLLID